MTIKHILRELQERQKSKTDFFLVSLVLYLFCLYPLVSESLISVFICKSHFNWKVSVYSEGHTEDPVETTGCIVSMWINVFHIMKASRRVFRANSKQQRSTCCTQAAANVDGASIALLSFGATTTGGLLLQKARCRKVSQGLRQTPECDLNIS